MMFLEKQERFKFNLCFSRKYLLAIKIFKKFGLSKDIKILMPTYSVWKKSIDCIKK
jgi:hypothetical protein